MEAHLHSSAKPVFKAISFCAPPVMVPPRWAFNFSKTCCFSQPRRDISSQVVFGAIVTSRERERGWVLVGIRSMILRMRLLLYGHLQPTTQFPPITAG
jgi:hypothetical protein